MIKPLELYDFAIIGAGVVGCAIAKKLSEYELTIALIEANHDVGTGTSKANTAILHTGFDAQPGSFEAMLLQKSYPLMKKYVQEVRIPFEETGAILIAWNEEEFQKLPEILNKSKKNGITNLKVLSQNEIYSAEPNLMPGACGGILVPGESIICPFSPSLAFAAESIINGGKLFLNTKVNTIKKEDHFYTLISDQKKFYSKWIINAAGLWSDEINSMLNNHKFKVTPRRGELIVFDKPSRKLISHILLPVPTQTTKGVLVSPTVFGNVLLGPTAENQSNKLDTKTTAQGITTLFDKGRKIVPKLLNEEVTATYTGLRAATEFQDYQISVNSLNNYVCVGGIRSTGLSASLGIAEYIQEQLEAQGISFIKKNHFKKIKLPWIDENGIRPSESQEKIRQNPSYGKIICHCEQVSVGEIKDAMEFVIPATTLDGLKRRTRCLQGRCQGFYCLAEICKLLGQS